MMKHTLLAGAAAVAMSVAPASIAQAQDTQAAADQDVIVVTGRKRPETLQSVPASATVIGQEALEALNLFDSVDLIRNIPNAMIAYGGGPDYLNVVIIRGAGAGRGPGSEPATGLYRNGIYTGSGGYGGAQFSRMDLFDVARAETFRGPQGALFGRNAVGGAINLVTRRPGDEFGGFVRASYNEWDRAEIQGAVDLSAGDGFALRLGGFWMDQSDGYIENTFTGEAADQRKEYGLRATAEIGLSENTSWLVLAEYFDQTAPSFAAFTYREGLDPFTRPFNGPSQVDIDTFTLSSELTHDFGSVALTVVGLYRDQSAYRIDDLDWFLGIANGQRGFLAEETSDSERYNFEIRLASTPGDGPLDWLIGADFMDHTEDLVTTNTTAAPAPNPFRDAFQSTAIFGSIDYHLSDRLTLGVEARATWDTKTLDQFNSGRSEEADFDNLTPVVSLSYEMSDRTTLYSRIGTAYRAGGFNRAFPAVTPSAASYDVEETISYEAGVKTRFENGLALDLGVFYMQSDGVQIVTRTPGQTATYIQNAGDADVYGLEGALRGRAELNEAGTEAFFDLGFSMSDGEYTAGAAVPFGAVVPVDIEGNAFPRLRDLTTNLTLGLEHPLTSAWHVLGQLNIVHESGGFEDTFNADQLADFTILDVRIGLRGDRFSIFAVGKNITDEFYVVERSGGGQIYSNRPSVWGLEVRTSF